MGASPFPTIKNKLNLKKDIHSPVPTGGSPNCISVRRQYVTPPSLHRCPATVCPEAWIPQTCSQRILGSVPALAAREGDGHDKHNTVVFDTQRGCLLQSPVLALSPQTACNGAHNWQSAAAMYGTLFFPLHLGLKDSLPTSDKSHFTPKQIGPRKIFVMIN